MQKLKQTKRFVQQINCRIWTRMGRSKITTNQMLTILVFPHLRYTLLNKKSIIGRNFLRLSTLLNDGSQRFFSFFPKFLYSNMTYKLSLNVKLAAPCGFGRPTKLGSVKQSWPLETMNGSWEVKGIMGEPSKMGQTSTWTKKLTRWLFTFYYK